jgi:hypothetical protein
MNKKRVGIFVFLFVFILLMLSFISAGLFGRITGKATIVTDATIGEDGWTNWLNQDDPFGTGDYEIEFNGVCNIPVDVQCRVIGSNTSFSSAADAEQVMIVSPTEGCSCVNEDNNWSCYDYEVRFKCNTKCTDSDNGLNYYKKGHIIDIESNNYEVDDVCINATTLREHYCGTNNYQYEYYPCPNGCVDGACVGDATPRVSFWQGKVNQHTENGIWRTDSDGISGAEWGYTEELRIKYCEKFYGSGVTSSPEYAIETIDTWCIAGNTVCTYYNIKPTYECVKSNTTSLECSSDLDCDFGSYCLNGSCIAISNTTIVPPLLNETEVNTSEPLPNLSSDNSPQKPFKVQSRRACLSGCHLDGKCYNIGYRKGMTYCGLDLNFSYQKEGSVPCLDNSECLSNVCMEGNCIEEGAWKKFMLWLKRAFRRGRS